MISTSIMLDTRDIDAALSALPKSIFRAQRSAVGTTTTWAKQSIQARMIAETGVDKRVFKKFRVKSRRMKESGKVWLGFSEVKAAYVGKLSQDAAGAWAGDYYFPRAFVARMESGHVGIFKRTGVFKKHRVKNKILEQIGEQTVNLNVGVTVGEDVARQAAQELKRRFIAKLREFDQHVK